MLWKILREFNSTEKSHGIKKISVEVRGGGGERSVSIGQARQAGEFVITKNGEGPGSSVTFSSTGFMEVRAASRAPSA